MDKNFEILKKSRSLLLKITEHLTIDQLNKIPVGFNNNIVWNIAHLVVTQQLLCYKLSGLPCLISDEMIQKFQKGSSPISKISADEFQEIKMLLLDLPKTLEEDYCKRVFKNYSEYTTSVGITIKNIDEAIQFNLLHEGIHLGIVLQLKKLI